MKLREIVCCYISRDVVAPKDMNALRKSFTDNGFREKVLCDNRFLYKRGAPIALEFNYDSEAIEVQVILERAGDQLKISVGNWGFPFEPLMMKGRFERTVVGIAAEITDHGRLEYNPEQAAHVAALSKEKSGAAKLVLLAAAVCAVAFIIVRNT
ncbi:MAG: hypothetical protein ACX931_05530 [Saccharospirillum sp.]